MMQPFWDGTNALKVRHKPFRPFFFLAASLDIGVGAT